jgi:hypothetical protein
MKSVKTVVLFTCSVADGKSYSYSGSVSVHWSGIHTNGNPLLRMSFFDAQSDSKLFVGVFIYRPLKLSQ